MQREVQKKIFKTHLGWVGIAVSGQGVCRVVLPKKERKAVERELEQAGESRQLGQTRRISSVIGRAVKFLQGYFSGRRITVDLPVDLEDHTEFQQAVWKAAAKIPFGETRSYGGLAKQIGRPRAARAVGQAMGANPVPVIVP